jgi:hypothetical protein
VKIMMLRVNGIISPASAAGHIVLSQVSPLGHSWDAGQPLIEPTSVTAGHIAKTNASHGGL